MSAKEAKARIKINEVQAYLLYRYGLGMAKRKM